MTPLPKWRLRLTSCLLLFLPVTSLAQTTPHITLQDLLSAEPVGQTALSPDGNTFAIIHNGQIALLPRAGGWPVTLGRLTANVSPSPARAASGLSLLTAARPNA